MASQYLLANNDSAETITVKVKHCGEIQNSIGFTYNITDSLQILWIYINYLQLTIKIFIVLCIISRI